MRLISMHIDNFGGLHNYDYKFEDGLNIVLQDNGWGKTTMAAFLKAMLYGFDSKRTKDITENERRRYLPWQGGNYGGTLVFEADGTKYRLTRSFGETARSDKTRIVNAATNTTARIDPEKIGDTLFKLDASAFQRSVFINQNGLSIDGAASSIHTRLNTLVSQANDVAAYDGAIADLTQQIKFYEKTGARGKLGDITRQIESLERQRVQLESEIRQQDTARERISRIDEMLLVLDRDLDSKKAELDKVSGEAKKKEASQKLLEDLNKQIADLQGKIDAITAELGGAVPEKDEIAQIRRQDQTLTGLKGQLSDIQAEYADLVTRHNELLTKYEGTMPSAEQLDEIQSTFSELQGVISMDKTPAEIEEPEGYSAIRSASESDPDYVEKLEKTIGSLPALEETIGALAECEAAILREKQLWEGNKKSYSLWGDEVKRLGPEMESLSRYAPEQIDPVIDKLDEIKKQEQLLNVRREELSGYKLTNEEKELIGSCPEQLPEIAETDGIIEKIREADRADAEIQSLSSRLEGEKSKESSLRLSLDQLSGLADDELDPVEEPKKSSGSLLIGIGALATAVGIGLAVIVMPELAAVSAVGAILAVLGIINNNKYKTQKQAYDSFTSENARREETRKKKKEIDSQLEEVSSSISDIQEKIAAEESRSRQCRSEAADWISKWAPAGTDCTEYAVRTLAGKFDSVRAAGKKKELWEEKSAQISDTDAQISDAKRSVSESCPEISGMDPDEALKTLRDKENKYKALFNQYQNAVRKEKETLEELGISKDDIEKDDPANMSVLTESRDDAEKKLNVSLDEFNGVLGLIGIRIDSGDAAQGIHKAEKTLGEYRHFLERAAEEETRREQKTQSVERLQNKLNESEGLIGTVYIDLELPERLAMIRKDIAAESSLSDRIDNSVSAQESVRTKLKETEDTIERFVTRYGKSGLAQEAALSDVLGKVSEYNELLTAKAQLDKQAASIAESRKKESASSSEEEKALRSSITDLEARRDELLIEYTQKGDYIRQADSSLEKYGDITQEINQLYEQKQKAQNTLIMLKRTIQLITQAKENLANRYLSKVEQLFNSYMHIWLENEAVRGILDIDFNIRIEENDKIHVAEGYSTGYCDLIDFCMRLALVDTLFESEQPFLILDDPFVNLDVDRLEKALELLNVMAANKQIVYFVCHPIRAIDTDEDSEVRAEFLKLAEETKKSLGERKLASASVQNRPLRKSPKELYKVKDPSAVLPIKPAKKDYIITNNIFSMQFIANEFGALNDNTYELFFIDAKGHVLNERQMLEVSSGELTKDRVTFSLNTREDSGDEYELMIRESGQDDYEVIARIPFKVNLTFSSFDF